METAAEKTLETHLKRTTIGSNIITILTALIIAIGVGYGFYYDTNGTLGEHTEKIDNVEKDVRDIKIQLNNTAVFQGTSATEVNALKERIIRIENSQIRIEDKLDKILLQTQKQ